MNIRTIFYGTAAAALLAAAGPAVLPLDLNLTVPAQAHNTSISFSVFYDDLAPHGDWVRYHGAYVFVPANVDGDWRPYTEGRWVYTSDYGWLWVSDEPFGWATYHYGRWGFAEDIGWYWVPGSRWAPAWVSWRRSHDYVVWAPLPPSGDPDIFIDISFGSIPDYYWIAVPAQSFLSVNLSVVIIDDDDDRRRIVREARDQGRVRADNDRIVNTAIEPEFIEERTGEKVPRREVRRSDKPGRGEVGEESVTVFNEDIAPERDRKPEKVKKVEEVRRTGTGDDQAAEERTDKRKKPAEEASEGVAEGPPDSPDPAADGRKKKPIKGVAEGPPDGPDPAESAESQPEGDEAVANNRKKKKPVAGAPDAEEQTVRPQRKKKLPVTEEAAEVSEEAPAQAPAKRRNKPAQQAAEQPGDEQATEPAAKQKKRQTAKDSKSQRKSGEAPACDPSVNPDCPDQ